MIVRSATTRRIENIITYAVAIGFAAFCLLPLLWLLLTSLKPESDIITAEGVVVTTECRRVDPEEIARFADYYYKHDILPYDRAIMEGIVKAAADRFDDLVSGQTPWPELDRTERLIQAQLDALVLGSMLARVGEYGFTPNRVAALGINVLLFANLAVAGVLGVRALLGRGSSDAPERWQMRYLSVFAAWALLMLLVLPPVFGYA